MKAKKGFNLREVCGQHIIVAQGKENIDFSNIISMNESSAWLWQQILANDMDFVAKDLAALLMEEYEVDAQTALADSETLIKQWHEAGIIE
jgi:hypothetical protein